MLDDLELNGDAEYLLWFSMPREKLVSIIHFKCTDTRLPLHRQLQLLSENGLTLGAHQDYSHCCMPYSGLHRVRGLTRTVCPNI